METRDEFLGRLRWLLVWGNTAMLCLAVGVMDMFPQENFIGAYGEDGISFWFKSHHTEGLPWFLAASVILSLAIYCFVAGTEMVWLKVSEPQSTMEAGAKEV